MFLKSKFEQIVDTASLQIERISEKVYSGEPHDWNDIGLQLQEVAVNLDMVLHGRNVPWRFYRRARELLTEISYVMNLTKQRECNDKILEMEKVLRSETSDAGWRAYLTIDKLALDSTAWKPLCLTGCYPQIGHHCMQNPCSMIAE